MKTPAKLFWKKQETKRWLAEHAPELKPAETFAVGLTRDAVPDALHKVFDERQINRAVVKPVVGRNGRGIVMVERTRDFKWKLPWGAAVGDGGLVEQLKHDVLADYPDSYLIEERFTCHPALTEFAFYPDTSPLFRLLFSKNHFIVGALYTASRKARGFAQILVGGQCLWFDETGLIRPPEDMNAPYGHRRGSYFSRTLDTNEHNYLTIEGMAELISYCEAVLCPIIEPEKNFNWGIDAIIDASGNVRVVEVNHSPGCQMAGWVGWHSLTVAQLNYAHIRGGLLDRGPT